MGGGALPGSTRLGLALSGGGFRAAVFHLGVLRYLAEEKLLEQVTQISTVSGGTLLTGAVFSAAGGKWPSSSEFLQSVYPSIRDMLVSEDLFSFRALGPGGILRQNTRILFRRANVLAWLIRKRWCISLRLSDLPKNPVWHINTTCLETGKNWRFTRDSMGDWQFGRHYSPDVALADAMAASAAVPYAIGALKLALPKNGWWQTDPATKTPTRKVEPRHASVRLWDGGAYENMALEPLYKPVEGLQNCDFLMCSDASAPLAAPSGILRSLLDGKLASPRLFDIASDQIRSLRSRMLMKSITQGEINGSLFRLGTPARDFEKASGNLPGLTDEECAFCLNYPTNLTKVAPDHFDLMAQHGQDVARMTTRTFENAIRDGSASTPAP
ncbi:patatin-like phospholipase family protein [Pseudaminobacter sp. 19-2017]|uniref:Patatin-like phospholipase family protein n=1 Tax=Pseudaminobacter soli (ex Zhang et al. 2022) TaxID=2831468 RepID=A0A942E1S4_9HYPH|nr:patatin-like phospholipase family protein [Pseudaminobacter soli]MBS3652199.1 patatin-like phospholipase family protein [Pseudaminobacter soli]